MPSRMWVKVLVSGDFLLVGTNMVAANDNKLGFRYISSVIWLALFLLTACVIVLVVPFPFWFALLVAFSLWGPYWLLSPFVFSLTNRFPLSRQHWKQSILIHLLGAVVFVVASESIFYVLITQLGPQMVIYFQEAKDSSPGFFGEPRPDFGGTYAGDLSLLSVIFLKSRSSLPLYWMLVAIAHGYMAMSALRLREQQSANLQTRLARAELAQLRTQLQPHFLFNTLNSIMALVESSPQAAKEMIWDLSELLRMILKQPDTDRITLKHELELLAYYIGIQKTRFGKRLEFLQHVDEQAFTATVPPLLLQPLVENAIHHGIEATGKAGTITLTAQLLAANRISLVLENFCPTDIANGASPDQNISLGKSNELAKGSALPSGGIGLPITRARLEAEYSDEYSFTAGWIGAGLYQVSLEIPLRELSRLSTPQS
jgi:two-component system, LytTR family, sensor kinase